MQQVKDSFPELSISHLISWTAFSAIGMLVGLAASRTIYAGLPDSMQLFLRASMVYQAIFFGATIVGVIVGIGRWRRGELFPLAPGHWVLIFLGVYVLTQALVVMTNEYSGSPSERNAYSITNGVGFCIVGVFATLAFMQFRDLGLWSTYFGLYSVVSIASALFHMVFIFVSTTIEQFVFMMHVVHWMATLAMVVAVAVDVSKRRKWDWLHWVGVAYGLVGILFSASSPWFM
ncbi:MAG: hypothetical protein AAF497_01725 [Planctomycetota bacterium]